MEDKSLSEVLAIKHSIRIAKSDEPADVGPLKLKVYKKRWLMLIIYMIYNGVNSLQWIEYSIITNIVTRYHIFHKIRTVLYIKASEPFFVHYLDIMECLR